MVHAAVGLDWPEQQNSPAVQRHHDDEILLVKRCSFLSAKFDQVSQVQNFLMPSHTVFMT